MITSRLVTLGIASILVTGLTACQGGADKSVTSPKDTKALAREAAAMKSDLHYLASDELEGRGLKTEGLQKAATFIADEFKEAGLKPLPGLDGYFQPFELTVDTTVSDKTSLVLGGKSLAREKDFQPLGFSASAPFKGEIAFVGYAINSTKYNYNDFSGIDVKGKVVLAMRYEPHNDGGKSRFVDQNWSDESSLGTKVKAAADAGAAAIILVNPPSHHGPDRLQSPARMQSDPATIPAMMVTNEVANALLKSAGAKNLKALQSEIDSTGKPASFALGNSQVASGEMQFVRDTRIVKNVVGVLPGKGPNKGQYIVVGAHYDHLGRGERGSLARNNKEIHNGADDNGSGTVSVIELARKMAAAGARDRSIIFMTFVGEERGLLGSEYFVNHCPVPLDKIVYMLNLDMVGRIQNDVLYVGGVGTADSLEALVKQIDEKSPLKLKIAGSDVGGKGGMGPSDHASFAGKKIPVLFLFSGMHPDYHRPTDDADKINYTAMAQSVNVAAMLVNELVEMPVEQYVAKFDGVSRGASGGTSVRLGIMPGYGEKVEVGVLVESVMPDTPASKAGVLAGDMIVGLGSDKTDTLEEYMTALNKHKPGDKVDVIVKRKGERLVLNATLEARAG